LSYFGSFVWEYATNLGHDTSPREIEADYGITRYDDFNFWLNTKKNTSISSLFNNGMGDTERRNKIRLVATQMKEKALLCAKNNKKDEVA
jgi:hypothetical protein